jgi:hypothetical protein
MKGGEQIATDPVQPLYYPEALGITPGDLQCSKGTIDRPDLGLGQGMRQADRQVAAARPDIEESQLRLRVGYTPLLRQTRTVFNQ